MTVEPVLTEKPSERKRDMDMVMMSDELEGSQDEKHLRLKGKRYPLLLSLSLSPSACTSL